jgi:hypothetical protein
VGLVESLFLVCAVGRIASFGFGDRVGCMQYIDSVAEGRGRVRFFEEGLWHDGPVGYDLWHIGCAVGHIGVVVESLDRVRLVGGRLRHARFVA